MPQGTLCLYTACFLPMDLFSWDIPRHLPQHRTCYPLGTPSPPAFPLPLHTTKPHCPATSRRTYHSSTSWRGTWDIHRLGLPCAAVQTHSGLTTGAGMGALPSTPGTCALHHCHHSACYPTWTGRFQADGRKVSGDLGGHTCLWTLDGILLGQD